LFDRPELISNLIAVAGVRMMAAAQRKLEPPVPAWFPEMHRKRVSERMFEALAFELEQTSLALESGTLIEEVRGSESLTSAAESIALRPVWRWGLAENEKAVLEEMRAWRGTTPCSLDSKAMNERLASRLSPLAERFSFVIPNIASTLSRAASADVALEGTDRILMLKSRKDERSGWPDSFPGDASSICSDARWVYAKQPGGGVSLTFSRKVEVPEDYQGPRIPLEFHIK
jgi:hypothetical protein